MSKFKISVLVIENHPMMREALCMAIADEPGMTVAAQAADSTQALSLVETFHPDIILLSLGNPGVGDIVSLAALYQACPATPILALTTNESPLQERNALAAGARAVLTKAAPRAELLETLRGMPKKAARSISASGGGRSLAVPGSLPRGKSR